MKDLDEIFYDALMADESLKEAVGERIASTCFEVAPDEQDNTPLPYIIVTHDGFVNSAGTKDNVWEGDEDVVQASVEVSASSRNEVGRLLLMVRRAISNYITKMYADGEYVPELMPEHPKSSGIAWDWTKPCYYTTLTYQCDIQNHLHEL